MWRFARRLGLTPAAAEDTAQQVFMIAAERMSEILVGSERAFLFATTLRVATTTRRKLNREHYAGDEDVNPSSLPLPDELTDRKRARQVLDAVLSEMSVDLRSAFILFELEGLTLREIADIMEIPAGTAASRLRRAREAFQIGVDKLFPSVRAHGGAA